MLHPLIIAHRGYSSTALENSLEAFRLSLSVPVDMIELDLRMTRDQGLYVMHDRQTGRTSDRNVDIERATSEEIAGLRLRNGQRIPSLDDVLDLIAGKVRINIEIKSDGAGEALAQHLSRRRYPGSIIVSSFKEAEVLAARNAVPAENLAMIYDTFSTRHVSAYKAKGYNLISLRKNTVTEVLVRHCHAEGVRLFVWTIDEEDEMKRCIEWEVDGIYTNRPGLLKDVVEKYCVSGM